MISLRIGLTTKFFVAILATSIVMALLVALALRISFERGFLAYLGGQHQERLQTVATELGVAWAQTQSWDFLETNDNAWRRWMGATLGRPPGDGDMRGGPPFDRPFFSPPHTVDSAGAPRGERAPMPDPPWAAGEDGAAYPPARAGPPPLPRRPFPLIVLDANRRVVAGHPAMLDEAELVPVRAAGQTVGWVGGPPAPRWLTDADRHFQRQQVHAAWITGALAVLIAIAMALLLARVATAPVKRLVAATRALSAGNYGVRVNARAHDELGQLSSDFNHLAHTLARNEGLRRAAMADLSHELRTPLSVLRGELEAIEDGVRQPDLPSLRSLQAEVATMGKLIDDLHQLSVTDVGALSYRKTDVDLSALVAQVAMAFRHKFAERAITVRLDCAPHGACLVLADHDRLVQMLNNLLENAVRYVTQGGCVTLICQPVPAGVHLVVADSGPGVPQAELGRLFERFYRARSQRHQPGKGSGLGLAIVANIVEAHDGTVHGQASPQGGLMIEIVLPVRAA